MIKLHYPERWDCTTLRSLFVENTEKNADLHEKNACQFRFGTIISKPQYAQTEELLESYRKCTVIAPGDIMINGLNLNYDFVTQRVALVTNPGIITAAYISLRPRVGVNSQFYYYLLKSLDDQKVFNGMGTGIRLTLSYKGIQNLHVPTPGLEEQNQIVHYLEWQTSRINKLINAKKRQIALLEEQKQGIVNAIVLGGASEDQERKDSGVAWIGPIPDHWNAVRCKYLFTEINERSEEGMETHLSMSQKYGLVPDSMLDERRMLSASYAGGKLCQEGDLVLNRLKAHLGVFALAPMEGVISPDYTVLRPNREYILPEFAEAVLKCTKCRPELRIRVRGIVEGFWRLYTDDFNTIYIPLPPIEEQRSIMQTIAGKQEHLNKLIKAITQEIELLQEYRTRLISDVVTGQVDVRDVVIPEYEAVQEMAEEEDETFEDETEMEEGE